jgi:hypothetical protein
MLYHYTDVDGLMGILNSESLRATRRDFLNDESELKYSVDFIRNALADMLLLGDDVEKILKIALNANLDLIETMGIYVTAFSRRKDCLEMWKGYTDNGGYSIEFDRQELLSQLPRTDSFYALVDIVYDEAIQKERVRSQVEEWRNEVIARSEELLPRLTSNVVRFDDVIPASDILHLVLSFKHPKFSYEAEARLAFFVRDDNKFSDLEIQFRRSEGRITPYIEYGLSSEASSIKSIMLGPLNRTEISRRGLELLLIKKRWAAPENFPQPILHLVNVKSSVCPVRF